MSVDSEIEQGPRARPVADAPVEALLARADDLARRWAIELIVARPLAGMAEIPLEDLAREAPGLCAQVLRSLASDAELQRLLAGEELGGTEGRSGSTPARRLAALTGARDAKAAVEQLEALRRVLWREMLGELRDPSPGLVADLADRLAFVASRVLAATLEQGAELVRDAPRMAPTGRREQVLYSSPRSSPGARGAVLIDERPDAPARPVPVRSPARAPEHAAPSPAGLRSSDVKERERSERPSPPEAPRTTARPLPWDTPLRPERTEGRPPPGAVQENGPSASSTAPDHGDPVMRITRRPASPVD